MGTYRMMRTAKDSPDEINFVIVGGSLGTLLFVKLAGLLDMVLADRVVSRIVFVERRPDENNLTNDWRGKKKDETSIENMWDNKWDVAKNVFEELQDRQFALPAH